MQSGMLKRKWQALHAATAAWMNGAPASRGDSRPEHTGYGTAAANQPVRTMPGFFSGFLLIAAILMLTFVAASAFVKASAPGHDRISYAKVEQQAAADYRKARARCQLLASSARETCIAEAHAAEARSRAVGTIGYRDYVAGLKEMTDAKIDAGDRDSIIVEPACNIVAKGQGSLCEIQLKSGAALAGTNLIPATAKATTIPASVAVFQPRTVRVKVQADPAPRPAAPPLASVASRQQDQWVELGWSNRQ